MDDIDYHPVFLGLARPAMMLGVTVDYFGAISIIALLLFMDAKRVFLAGFLWFTLYAVGWLICKHDPYFFTVIMKKTSFRAGQNKDIWGIKSYAPY